MLSKSYCVRIETLGCRLNQVESESLAALFSEEGFEIFEKKSKQEAFKEELLLCVINTCTVTGKAEQKGRGLIRLLLKEHPNALIIVTGCYAQLEARIIEAIDSRIVAFPGSKKDSLSRFPHLLANMLSSIDDTDFLFAQIKKLLIEMIETFSKDSVGLFALSASKFLFHSRATVKVQDGCNSKCAYCRIRLARGKSVSLPPYEVIARIKKIEDAGIGEVVISGVNLSQYQSDEGDFVTLLDEILKQTATIRVRISSLYPERIDAALLPVLANPRICPHFHLSVQSGSNEILMRMKRPYKRDDIYRAVENLRKIKERPFIAVDIITGFPGETEEDFAETYQMCKDLSFAGIHAFPFSARPGTLAWDMKPKIPQRVAGERVKLLNELAKKQESEYIHRWQGKSLFAIVEKPKTPDWVPILTENYLSLKLVAAEHSFLGGEYVRVVVDGAYAHLCS